MVTVLNMTNTMSSVCISVTDECILTAEEGVTTHKGLYLLF